MSPLRPLNLINQIDSFPYELDVETVTRVRRCFYTFVFDGETGRQVPVGFVPSKVLDILIKTPASIRGEIRVDPVERTVSVFMGSNEEARSALAARLAQYWRSQDAFPILRGWRDELWPVYGTKGELLFNLERSATGLFGVVRYGVHLNGFVRCDNSSFGIKLWVARRSPTKSTFPGMLDNIAAGGLMSGEDPFECIVREAEEEADLAESFTRERIKAVEGVTYIYVTQEEAGEAGLIYPEVQWVYDLELPEHVLPRPKDGEVAEFNLCTVEEVQQQLSKGQFKPNCALVVVDFFIRHGIITRDIEPSFDEIMRRIHRKLPFPGPHKHESFSVPRQAGKRLQSGLA
ncbi:thiamine pyrophosphokinase [Sodiomyces alkalinus F11]|uniref:Thiamine pyrophosphokinase n=1 Tax=Sodiomyces alkalinus (strain CBS 110278 / VKM F-3762 / F11) TaxID=1314773 RepID=A0A3N2PJZ7_SODAK|nr:thiamine pyrophosphokinase [Sodiomyces alkalinus F11]ROT34829.1 thiamine pyrophosphokinase [Sodiomyces alkalinus F11]